MRPTNFSSVVNRDELTEAEDTIFWRKVREAYAIVAADASKIVEFTASRRVVVCRIAKDGSGKIVLHISEGKPDPVKLIVPPGGSTSDE